MGLFDWLKPAKREEEPTEVVEPPTREDIEKALAGAEEMVMKAHASTPVLARVLRISTVTKAILPRLEDMGYSSADAYTVVATATAYMPESVAGYLSLPREWADTRPVANGKSSLLLLIDQLDLLSLTISRMYDASNRADAEALVAQGQFLAEKFGRPSKPIRPTPTPASSNPLDL